MCRFIAYVGKALTLDQILIKPTDSLIRQSERARDTDVPLNGDGFGLGWYVPEIDTAPALFRSIQPAWNDANLLSLAPKIFTNCFFAHVRAAEIGEIAMANCHPFVFKDYMFMHNGSIGGFNKIKRKLRARLSDEIYDWIGGHTDSEHFFGLFLQLFLEQNLSPTAENCAQILRQAIQEIESLQKTVGVVRTEINYLNCVITNGRTMVASRYVSNVKEKASSLYYSAGREYQCINGTCHMLPAEDRNKAVLIASERLTNYRSEWKEVPTNHFLLVKEGLKLEISPI